MRLQLISGEQMFVPDTDEEKDLVRYVLTGMVTLVCPSFLVWERPDSVDGPWFSASTSIPYIQHDTNMSDDEEEDDRPYIPRPHVCAIQVCLPASFMQNTSFGCRLHPTAMKPESLKWMIECLDKYVFGTETQSFTDQHFNDALCVHYMAKLEESRRYKSWKANQPHHFMRRFSEQRQNVTPLADQAGITKSRKRPQARATKRKRRSTK